MSLLKWYPAVLFLESCGNNVARNVLICCIQVFFIPRTFDMSVVGHGVGVMDDGVPWGELGSGLFQVFGIFLFVIFFLIFIFYCLYGSLIFDFFAVFTCKQLSWLNFFFNLCYLGRYSP